MMKTRVFGLFQIEFVYYSGCRCEQNEQCNEIVCLFWHRTSLFCSSSSVYFSPEYAIVDDALFANRTIHFEGYMLIRKKALTPCQQNTSERER